MKTKATTGHIKYGTAGFRSEAENLPHVNNYFIIKYLIWYILI